MKSSVARGVVFTTILFLLQSLGNFASASEVPRTTQSGSTHSNIQSLLFVLDCSSSMNSKLKLTKGDKLNCEKTFVRETLNVLPANIKCGLRLFGEDLPGQPDCENSVLREPLGAKNHQQIRRILESVKNAKFGIGVPKEMTPLVLSIDKALNKDLDSDQFSVVILLTDGVDSCGRDLCQFIDEVPKSRWDKCQIFVLSLNEQSSHGYGELVQKQNNTLKHIAETSHGRYFPIEEFDSFLVQIKKLTGSKR